jgi:hypothetical protein
MGCLNVTRNCRFFFSSGFLPDPPLDMAGSRIAFTKLLFPCLFPTPANQFSDYKRVVRMLARSPEDSLVCFDTGAGRQECCQKPCGPPCWFLTPMPFLLRAQTSRSAPRTLASTDPFSAFGVPIRVPSKTIQPTGNSSSKRL